MDWRELITGMYPGRPPRPGIAWAPRFYPAAPEGDIAGAEARLGATFPPSLRSLLAQTDGVMDRMAVDGGEWFDALWLLWPVAEVVERNRSARAAAGGGPRGVIFFADAGCDGILFGHPVVGQTCGPGVVVWHPMRGRVADLAPSLDGFLRGWLAGTISV